MSRRVLVTGSRGYIGRHLTEKLREQAGTQVFGFNRTYDQRLQASDCLEGDLLSADLGGWCARVKPDVVFHAVGASPKMPFSHQLLINAEGTRRLLQALVDRGLRPRVIVVGSAAEYGLQDEPVDESAICAPEGEYGIAKLAQTQIAQNFARRYDLPVVIGRVFNVYGHSERHLAVASLASQIAQAEAVSPLPAELHAFNLKSRRDFVHMEDVTRALLSLAEPLGHNESRGQIYNIGSGRATGLHEVLRILLSHALLDQAALKKVELKLHGPQKEDVSLADRGRLSGLTGWEPQVSLEEGLRRELHYWRNHVGKTVPALSQAGSGY